MTGARRVDKSQSHAIDRKAPDAIDPPGGRKVPIDAGSSVAGLGEPYAVRDESGARDRRQRVSGLAGMVLVGIFLALIFAPLVKMAFSEKTYFSSAEKRRLAEPPELKFDWQSLRKFFPGFEAYFNDHFGYRETFIRGYNRILYKYFAKSPVPDVLFGKDGWLFVTKNKVIEDYLGFTPLSPAELRVIEDNLRTKQRWLAARGIAYLFVVVPGKQTIYPEYLPDYIYTRPGRTRLDQLTAYLADRPGLNFLELRPALLAAKKRHRIYHLTDTHWNLRGAYAGYQKIMEKLQEMFPRLDLAARNHRETKTLHEKGGDLAVMIKKEETMREVMPVFESMSPCANLNELRLDAWDTSGSLEKAFYTECPTGQLTAIVFRDSFASLLVPFMADHFKKAVFLWRYYDQQLVEDLLTTFKPDIVIEEMGERRLFRDATEKLVMD